MSWTWRYEIAERAGGDHGPGPAGPDGPAVPDVSEEFSTRSDAETWIGLEWEELFARGVTNVTLFEDGQQVGPPMSLAPPD